MIEIGDSSYPANVGHHRRDGWSVAESPSGCMALFDDSDLSFAEQSLVERTTNDE